MTRVLVSPWPWWVAKLRAASLWMHPKDVRGAAPSWAPVTPPPVFSRKVFAQRLEPRTGRHRFPLAAGKAPFPFWIRTAFEHPVPVSALTKWLRGSATPRGKQRCPVSLGAETCASRSPPAAALAGKGADTATSATTTAPARPQPRRLRWRVRVTCSGVK